MYRWRNFQADLKRGYEGVSLNTWLSGLELIMVGVIQKFGLAELIWRYGLSTLDAHDYSFTGVALNASLYSAYLFFDFAGYSTMAIGIGMLFGFNLPINFRNPLATLNPQDFWRRWHISLSEWLRDVVFMPIYKALSKTAFFGRHRMAAQNIGIFATLLAMGVWNGLSPHYIVSGLMFGAYSVGHNLLVNAARTRPGLQAALARPDALRGARVHPDPGRAGAVRIQRPQRSDPISYAGSIGMRFDLKSFDFVECERAPDALAVAAADRNLSWAQLRAEALAWADAARVRTARRRMCRWPSMATSRLRSSWRWSARCWSARRSCRSTRSIRPSVCAASLRSCGRRRFTMLPLAALNLATARRWPNAAWPTSCSPRAAPAIRRACRSGARAWACWATGCWAVSDWATRRCS